MNETIVMLFIDLFLGPSDISLLLILNLLEKCVSSQLLKTGLFIVVHVFLLEIKSASQLWILNYWYYTCI